MSERLVVLHGHIFKNAGTTLDWALARNFGADFIDHREDEEMRSGRYDYLLSYLKSHLDVRAISSHHMPLHPPAAEGFRFFPISILRHPIERARSVYRFERQQDSHSPGAQMAKKTSFPEYVRWRMEPKVGGTIRNHHVHYCGGWIKGPGFPPLEEIATLARNYITANPLIGLVERFEESMVLFEEHLRPYFPEIDLAYLSQNVMDTPQELPLVAKLEQIRAELGEEVYELLVHKNHCDLTLHQFAEEVFAVRCAAVPGFKEKLEHFRRRCRSCAD